MLAAAAELGIDVEIRETGRSRDKAIEYFKDNAAKTEQDIVNEIDRYIAWPGQALAYKIGEIRIKEMRKKLSRDPKFDLKKFHDAILKVGPMPLDLLERQVTEAMR